MREVFMIGREFDNVEEIHDFLAKELEFPKYYGGNLSALYDVLTDLCDDTRILVDCGGILNSEVCDYLERMAEVLADAADENVYLEVEIQNL